jgi:hypothetical protein
MVTHKSFLNIHYSGCLEDEIPSSTALLVADRQEQYTIIKKTYSGSKYTDISYELFLDKLPIAMIAGHIKRNTDMFHINRIENLLHDHTSGWRYLPRIFTVLEQDMRISGMKLMTTECVYKLVPVVMKRYGFQPRAGKTFNPLIAKILGIIPGVGLGLEKKLISET